MKPVLSEVEGHCVIRVCDHVLLDFCSPKRLHGLRHWDSAARCVTSVKSHPASLLHFIDQILMAFEFIKQQVIQAKDRA